MSEWLRRTTETLQPGCRKPCRRAESPTRGGPMATEMDETLDPTLLLFSPPAADDPREAYRQLRDECPVAQSDLGAYISRYEDVAWALRHPEIFSSQSDALDIGQAQPLIPLQVDPPLHTKYRRLLNPWFTQKKVAELEADVVVLVSALIDEFVDRGECDFHEEYATPLPSTIFLRLMGLPQSDLEMFLK